MVEEDPLPDYLPSCEREKHGPLIVECGSATRASAPDTALQHQPPVAEVDDFVRFEPKVAPISEPLLLEANAAFPPMGPFKAEGSKAGASVKLAVWGVERTDNRFVIAPIESLDALPGEVADEALPKPGTGGQPQRGAGQKDRETGKPHSQTLIEAAARLSRHGHWQAHDLYVLLRHGPRSICTAQS